MAQELPQHTLTAVSLAHLMRLGLSYGISPSLVPRYAALVCSSFLSFPCAWWTPFVRPAW